MNQGKANDKTIHVACGLALSDGSVQSPNNLPDLVEGGVGISAKHLTQEVDL